MYAVPENAEIVRSIVQRIRRLLVGFERARRQPNRREAYYICMAIEHLYASRLTAGEDALSKAERIDPLPPDVAIQAAFNETPTVEQLSTAVNKLSPE